MKQQKINGSLLREIYTALAVRLVQKLPNKEDFLTRQAVDIICAITTTLFEVVHAFE